MVHSMESFSMQGVNEKTDHVTGRINTQFGINIANIINNGDGELFSSMYPQIQNSIGISIASLGLITSASGIAQTLIAPLWGVLSDRHSRKNLLAFGCFLWGIFTLLEGFGTTFMYFLIINACAGAGLTIIIPTAQSLISDYYPSGKRGRFFGCFNLIGNIGVLLGSISVFLLELLLYVLGLYTLENFEEWRWMFITWGILSLVSGALVFVLVKEPVRGSAEPEINNLLASGKIKETKMKYEDYGKVFTNRTFWLIIGHGIAGMIPLSGLVLLITWFEYVGFSPMTSFWLFLIIDIGIALGNLLGGFLGDLAEKKRPASGRIIICQISIASGIPLAFIMLFILPMAMSSFLAYAILGAIMGLCSSWCSPQNATILSQVFDPEIRGLAYSFDRFFKGLGMIFLSGTLLVSIIAVGFGFVTPPFSYSTPNLFPVALRMTNALALSWGIFLVTLIPWIISLLLYALMYLTYPRDVKNARDALKIKMEESKIE